jgi:hypothetical protein
LDMSSPTPLSSPAIWMSRRFEGSSSTANSVFTHSLASARRIRPCPYDATALINPRSFSETPIGLSAREGALGKVVDGPDRSCHRGDHGCQTNVECSPGRSARASVTIRLAKGREPGRVDKRQTDPLSWVTAGGLRWWSCYSLVQNRINRPTGEAAVYP